MTRKVDTLTSKEALKLVEAALHAAQLDSEFIAVAVVDVAGQVLAVARHDDAPGITCEIAAGKARSAAAFRVPTAAVMNDTQRTPQIGVSLMAVPGLMLLVGGLPVFSNGVLVGGIGVSGGKRDPHHCEAAIATIPGLTTRVGD